jgi:hypothetical protein
MTKNNIEKVFFLYNTNNLSVDVNDELNEKKTTIVQLVLFVFKYYFIKIILLLIDDKN